MHEEPLQPDFLRAEEGDLSDQRGKNPMLIGNIETDASAQQLIGLLCKMHVFFLESTSRGCEEELEGRADGDARGGKREDLSRPQRRQM